MTRHPFLIYSIHFLLQLVWLFSCNENANNPAASVPLPTFPSHLHHHLRPLPEPLREILPDAPETPNPGAARVRRIRSGGRP